MMTSLKARAKKPSLEHSGPREETAECRISVEGPAAGSRRVSFVGRGDRSAWKIAESSKKQRRSSRRCAVQTPKRVSWESIPYC